MSIDSVRKHIRAALDEIVASEKKRLHEFYDKSDANIAKRCEVMSPVIDAVEVLRREVAEVKGLTISSASYGHMVTIELKGGASTRRLSISTTYDNSQYQIEDRTWYSFDVESSELTHRLSTPNEVLELIAGAVGKHVASMEVLDERRAGNEPHERGAV